MSNDTSQDPWLGEPPPQPGGDEPQSARRSEKPAGVGQEAWERGVLERLLFASLKEQRRARRWGIFFKLAFLGYLIVLLFAYWPLGEEVSARHTALVELDGVIADDSEASADHIIASLRRAFKNSHAAGVILRINSPGGSPVQAGYINDEIKRLRKEYPDKKLYAVITDICASGGYYVAAAADEIYADKASVVGSIGVLMDGFGFTEAMNKLGIERRLITAGEHKGFLDPFSPLKEEDKRHVQQLLADIHRQFINVVREGRGTRLKENDQLFSGLVWTGEQGLALGLVDGLGSSSYVAREIIGAEDIVDYTYRPPYFERFAERLGVALAKVLPQTLASLEGRLQ